ncbi:MAG: STAS domain-containing protein [Candidatus Omnitrophica bacterium]|nr:STAS domain-containing protein [Candidatus Omnitrophota bacterium]
MKIQVKNQSEGFVYVTLEGELDFDSSPAIRQEFTKFTEKNPTKVLINLKKVTYIDSSGLATFIELFQKMKRSQGKLVLFNLSEGVRSVFEIAKLDSIFHLAKSEEEALALTQ